MYNIQDTIVYQMCNSAIMLQTTELQRAMLSQTQAIAAQQAQLAQLRQAVNIPYPAYPYYQYPYPYPAYMNLPQQVKTTRVYQTDYSEPMRLPNGNLARPNDITGVHETILGCCCDNSAAVRPTPKAEPPESKPPTYPPTNNPISPFFNHHKVYFNEKYFPEYKPKRSFLDI